MSTEGRCVGLVTYAKVEVRKEVVKSKKKGGEIAQGQTIGVQQTTTRASSRGRWYTTEQAISGKGLEMVQNMTLSMRISESGMRG